MRTGVMPPKSRRRLLGGYAAWLVVLTAAYFRLPGLRAETWGLIGLTGVAAIAAGVIINRPSRKLPWILLAAALACFAAGQVSFLVAKLEGKQLPFPSFADGLYLSTYPLYAAALLIFIWWRSPDRDRQSLIDAMTLTAGLALLSWLYLILPYVHNPALSGLQKTVAVAYPLGDVLVLAMIARLLAPGSARARCVQLLTLGVVGGLVSDTAYGLIQLHGTFHNGTIVDLGWALFYGVSGAAALHPTMRELTEPGMRQDVEVSPFRLTVLMLASLLAPIALFTESLRRHDTDESVIAVFSAILYLLVLSRLWDVATSHRRTLGRERAVRQAGVSFAAAVTAEQVATAVSGALRSLVGKKSRGDALLATATDGTFTAVSTVTSVTDAAAAPERMSQLGAQAGGWLPLVEGSTPLLTPVTSLPRESSGLVNVDDWVLLCPLALKDRPSGDPLIGVLAVFGAQRVLADLYAAMEIVAHQAALALERIMLSHEVIRQGQEAYFRTLVQDTSDIILIVADDGKVRYATPSATSLFGDIAVEGAYLWDLVAEGERSSLTDVLLGVREGVNGSSRYVDRRITRRDGVPVQVQVRFSDLRDDPTVAGLVLTLRDVTAQRQLEDQLKHQAFHDALTGLPNRVLFQDRITHQLAAVRREGAIAGVLFVDLDDFKIVNDTMGHAVGDELLAAVAARLAGLIRESDTAARLGGDEFALLIGGVQDTTAVEAAAGRVVEAFRKPFQLASGSVITTVTVGVATTTDSADTDELLRHADLALYAAKAAGKRQWRRYQPVLSTGMMRRRELQAALEDAVARSAFTLAYQPIISLANGEITGFEALVRWPHAEWGMMQPDQFIALAEETGHIIALGSWVLGQAAEDVARWREDSAPNAPGGGVYASVNVSARQFSDPGFVDGVRRVLDSSGLAPGALMLELTESVLLRRDDRVHADLIKLKSIGVRLAIDDFGTGYSSLSYLRELPIDVLKMDKSFVDGINSSPQRLALAEGIIQIARTLQLAVIAEGIESQSQWDLLASLGCQFGQGYLMAMPMPAADACELTMAAASKARGHAKTAGT